LNIHQVVPDFVLRENDPVNLSVADKVMLSSLLPTTASRERLQQILDESLPDEIWTAILTRAEALGTLSLLRFHLTEQNLWGKLPDRWQNKVIVLTQLQAARHLAYTSEALRLMATFQQNNITAIPLKGVALMLGGYYPQPGMRTAVDIDLLIDPAQISLAEQSVIEAGYLERIYVASARPGQRLVNEMNHLPPRRGPGGILLELHHRAFHYVRGERDFSFAEIRQRAQQHTLSSGNQPGNFLMPAPEDLSVHLIHHTLVDLVGTKSFLRTIADLYFIRQQHPEIFRHAEIRAAETGFAGAVRKAEEMLCLLADGQWSDFDRIPDSSPTAALLEAGLLKDAEDFSEAARLLEYFDLRRNPIKKFRQIFSLIFTTRRHLSELYQQPDERRVYLKYWRRPFDLLKKIRWSGLRPSVVRRVLKLRRLVES
jgi:hypothetical protein